MIFKDDCLYIRLSWWLVSKLQKSSVLSRNVERILPKHNGFNQRKQECSFFENKVGFGVSRILERERNKLQKPWKLRYMAWHLSERKGWRSKRFVHMDGTHSEEGKRRIWVDSHQFEWHYVGLEKKAYWQLEGKVWEHSKEFEWCG